MKMKMKMKRWSMRKRKMMRIDLCDHHKRCKQVMKHYGNGRVWTMIKVEPRFRNIGSSTPEDTNKLRTRKISVPSREGSYPHGSHSKLARRAMDGTYGNLEPQSMEPFEANGFDPCDS